MRFRNMDEEAQALLNIAERLPILLQTAEKFVTDIGWRVAFRVMCGSPGAPNPTFRLIKNENIKMDFSLGNALDEFLSVDRDDRPMRLDPDLLDEEKARRKLASCLSARIEMARACYLGKTPEEVNLFTAAVAHKQKLSRFKTRTMKAPPKGS
jgi:hypothetical protein